MNKIKNQLKFNDSKKAEDFFDCPMSKNDYVEMLKEKDELQRYIIMPKGWLEFPNSNLNIALASIYL